MDYLPTVILETTSTLLGEASVDIAMKFTQYPDPNSYRISFDWEDGWKKLCRFFPFMVIWCLFFHGRKATKNNSVSTKDLFRSQEGTAEQHTNNWRCVWQTLLYLYDLTYHWYRIMQFQLRPDGLFLGIAYRLGDGHREQTSGLHWTTTSIHTGWKGPQIIEVIPNWT